MLTLTGFIGIEAAGSGTTARLEITGAVSAKIALLGSLVGHAQPRRLRRASNTGVVGRVFLARSGGGGDPGRRDQRQLPARDQLLHHRADDRHVQDQDAHAGRADALRRLRDGRPGQPDRRAARRSRRIAGFSLKMAGSLIVGPLTITGEVLFRLELAGANAGIELSSTARSTLGPLGSLRSTTAASGSAPRASSRALDQHRRSTAASAAASASSSRSARVVRAQHHRPHADARRRARSRPASGCASTARSTFLGFAEATGYLDITITNNSFQMAAGLKFTIGPLVFNVSGSLGIYSNGLTATLDVTLDLNLLGDHPAEDERLAEARHAARPAKYFRLEITGKLDIFGGIISLSGGVDRRGHRRQAWSITIPETTKLGATFGPLSIYGLGLDRLRRRQRSTCTSRAAST